MAENKGFDRRLVIGGGAALALGGAYLALKPGQSGNKSSGHFKPEPGTFYRGNAAEPFTLDPSLVDSTWEDPIVGDMIVGLTTGDTMDNPLPGMAESWQASADGLTWTFSLRDAQWSDGVPVTADDFLFAWRHTLDPKTASSYAYFLYIVKNAEAVNTGKAPPSALGARAIDPHTLEVSLNHPAPYLLQMLMHTSMMPQPRHVVEKLGKDWTRPGNYVCNGPFMLTEWVPNDHITLVKNPRFHDADNVSLKKIVFYPTSDYGAALRRLRAGELDAQDRMENTQYGWIKSNMPELLDQVPQLIVDLIAVNHTRKPFNDIRVRRALNLAINREAITGKIIPVGNVPAYSVVPPGTANFAGGNVFDFKAMDYGRRLAEARALMQQAGFGPDKRLRFNYMIRNTSAGSYRAVAAALQQMFALIYLDITIAPTDAQIFYKTIQEQDVDVAQPGWQADFNDASNFLDLFRTGGGNNWGNYSNPEFDRLFDEAQHEIDIESRGRKLAEAEMVLLKDEVCMPLFFWVSGNLVRPYLKGWVANNMDVHRSRWMSIDEKARAAIFT